MRALRHMLVIGALVVGVLAVAESASVGRSRNINCMIPNAADTGDGGGTPISGTVCGVGYTAVVVQNNNANAHVYLGFPQPIGDGGVAKVVPEGFTTRNYALTGFKYGPTSRAGNSWSGNVQQNAGLACIGEPNAGQDASVPIAVMCVR